MNFPKREMAARRLLDDDLDHLRALLLEMTDTVDAQFSLAVQALLDRNLEQADGVFEGDREVDALEIEIDGLCERILARQQPVARDLRLLITAIKITTDIERIGDHCKSLARNISDIKRAPDLLRETQFTDMVDESRRMLRQAQDAFQKEDALLARKVIARDRHVNRIHGDNFDALVAAISEHPEHVEAGAHMIAANKAIERIGDHVKNIAESIVFLIEGEDIRHRGLKKEASTPEDGDSAPSLSE